jgi:hypothetical protein
MQTFLPSSNILWSAMELDSKRLNKQILEAYQILKTISTGAKAWGNHPAVLMWKGHEQALASYARTMASEAEKRGIKVDKNLANLDILEHQYGHTWGTNMPKWFDKESMSRIVATHRANLYRKDPIFYEAYATAVTSEYNKPCCEKCLYFWPTHPLKKAK